MRRIGKLARRTTNMKPQEKEKSPETAQAQPTIENMLNTILSSIIAKHQQALHDQLMELQKSLQQTPKKEEQNENNKKDNS